MKYVSVPFVFALLLGYFASLQIVCGQVAAAHQLSAPKVGVIRYSSGDVYLLYGLPGSYVIGLRVLDQADALCFSERGGLVARQGSLSLLRPDFSIVATFETGESSPVLGISGDLTTTIAWLPSTQKLAHWNGQEFVSVSVPDLLREGNVSFVSKRDDKTAVLTLHSTEGSVSQAFVSLETGQILSVTKIAGAHGPSYQYESFVIYQDNHELVVMTPADGNTKRFPLTADGLNIEQASSNCLHLQAKTAQRDWLLHFHNGDLGLTELPAPAAEARK
jgi:hypothetical protein